MNAILIARVSTEDQRDAGNSLPAQLNRLQSYCQRKGFKVIKEFDFDESAYKGSRDEFSEIVKFILSQKEPVAVCFDKVDRLSRNIFDQRVSDLYHRAINDELELHFISDNQVINGKLSAGDKFNFSIQLGLAKYYSDAISDNVKRAREQQLRSGQWPGPAPFGYMNTELNSKKHIEPDLFNAEVVKKIFEWYASGNYSMLEVRNKVKADFMLTMSKAHIGQILVNPFYCGVMRTNGREYPHKYTPIISQGLFIDATNRRKSFNKQPFKYAGLDFFSYRGLITCAECGCRITPEQKKGKYNYYHCTGFRGKHGASNMREEDLTDQFAKALEQLVVPEHVYMDILTALKASHGDKREFHDKLLAEYQARYNTLSKRIAEMYEDKLDGSITKEHYHNLYEKYHQEQIELEVRIKELREAEDSYYLTASYLLELSQRAAELFKSSEPAQKRQILNLTVQNLSLEGEIVRYDWKNPFSTLADYANRQLWLRGLDSNQQP